MQIISTIKEVQEILAEFGQVGFVPTMGYLHEGHFSLVRQARKENEKVVVSIFINPTQFGPQEDLSKYPRNPEKDIEMLEKLGTDIVFTPSVSEMYPDGFATYVEPAGALAEVSEGASRPGHFRGVATIVLKLFQIIQPDNVYIGQKDAQQAAVISRMIKDLNLPVILNVMPIIRESDGLAMSSRNAYLNGQERAAALILYKALQAGKNFIEENSDTRTPEIIKIITDLVKAEPLAQLDYVQIRDPKSFKELETIQAPALLLVAAKVGPARLIDNFLLREDGSWNTGVII